MTSAGDRTGGETRIIKSHSCPKVSNDNVSIHGSS